MVRSSRSLVVSRSWVASSRHFSVGSRRPTSSATRRTRRRKRKPKLLTSPPRGKPIPPNTATAMNDAKAASDILNGAQKDLAASLQSTAEKTLDAMNATLAKSAQTDLAARNALLGVLDAQDNLTAKQQEANDAAQFGIDKSREVEEAHNKVQAAILQVIKASVDKAAADTAGLSKAEQAKAAVDAQTNAIAFLAATVPGATAELDRLGYVVRTLPDGKTIVITADVSQALERTQALITAYNSLPGPNVPTGGGFFQVHGASGGWVPGSGNRDTVPRC